MNSKYSLIFLFFLICIQTPIIAMQEKRGLKNQFIHSIKTFYGHLKGDPQYDEAAIKAAQQTAIVIGSLLASIALGAGMYRADRYAKAKGVDYTKPAKIRLGALMGDPGDLTTLAFQSNNPLMELKKLADTDKLLSPKHTPPHSKLPVLFLAIKTGDPDVLDLLFGKFTYIDFNESLKIDKMRTTGWQYAAEYGSPKIIKYLTEQLKNKSIRFYEYNYDKAYKKNQHPFQLILMRTDINDELKKSFFEAFKKDQLELFYRKLQNNLDALTYNNYAQKLETLIPDIKESAEEY